MEERALMQNVLHETQDQFELVREGKNLLHTSSKNQDDILCRLWKYVQWSLPNCIAVTAQKPMQFGRGDAVRQRGDAV